MLDLLENMIKKGPIGVVKKMMNITDLGAMPVLTQA